MTNVADPKPPNGITLEDLDKQTEQVKAAFTEQVESVRTDSAQQVAQAESDHKISLLMEQIGATEAAAKIEIDRKFNKYFLLLIVAFGLLLTIGAVSYFQILNPQAGQSVFVLSDVVTTGSTKLCPGDSLSFSFDVDAKESGPYILYMSTWRVSPEPATVIFSEIEPFVVGNQKQFSIARQYLIELTYKDPATNQIVDWEPGGYSRNFAVIAAGRNTESLPLIAQFTIRDDCPNYRTSYHSPLYSNPLRSIR